MDNKKKDSLNHQQMVNEGKAKYIKTETPGKKIGGQASMDSISFSNKTIEKFNPKKEAIKSVIKNAIGL